MTIRRILIDGDPVLHSPTRPVTVFDSGLREGDWYVGTIVNPDLRTSAVLGNQLHHLGRQGRGSGVGAGAGTGRGRARLRRSGRARQPDPRRESHRGHPGHQPRRGAAGARRRCRRRHRHDRGAGRRGGRTRRHATVRARGRRSRGLGSVLAAGGIADGHGLAAALVLGWPGRWSAPGSWRVWSRLPHPPWRRHWSRVTVRKPKAAGCRTSRQAYRGPASTQADQSGTRSATGGAVGGGVGGQPQGTAVVPRSGRGRRPGSGPAWAGEDIDLIHDIEPAVAIVETLASGAEHALARAVSGRLSRPPLVSACPGLGMATPGQGFVST
jgi:hypothetical protein